MTCHPAGLDIRLVTLYIVFMVALLITDAAHLTVIKCPFRDPPILKHLFNPENRSAFDRPTSELNSKRNRLILRYLKVTVAFHFNLLTLINGS
jgi:hypothetical protein